MCGILFSYASILVKGLFLTSNPLLDFGPNEEDAQNALQIIKKYRFSQIRFIGRPAMLCQTSDVFSSIVMTSISEYTHHHFCW
jgi:hypothetical protein